MSNIFDVKETENYKIAESIFNACKDLKNIDPHLIKILIKQNLDAKEESKPQRLSDEELHDEWLKQRLEFGTTISVPKVWKSAWRACEEKLLGKEE